MKNQKTMGNKGFSLVELIVVIAIMVVLVAIAIFVLTKTSIGRDVYAAGDNPEAARLVTYMLLLLKTKKSEMTSQL